MQIFSNTVQCPNVTSPMDGTISCSLINDALFLFEDVCNFTCNTGYELSGSNSRVCQSDESWSGNDTVCTRGKDMKYFKALYLKIVFSCMPFT